MGCIFFVFATVVELAVVCFIAKNENNKMSCVRNILRPAAVSILAGV
uniref:Uncharacterized protein n=1 Tax=Romanomermis culicivorax TaxID=13658 RepID=A0A915IS19_ROMCU